MGFGKFDDARKYLVDKERTGLDMVMLTSTPATATTLTGIA
jgi:hypothetical protein